MLSTVFYILAVLCVDVPWVAQGAEPADALAKISKMAETKDPRKWEAAAAKLGPIVGNEATATTHALRLFIDVCLRLKRPERMAQAREACTKLCKMKDGRSAIYGDIGLLRYDRVDGKQLSAVIELARALVERYKTESGVVEAAYFPGTLYEENKQFKEAKDSFGFGRARRAELASKTYYFGEMSDKEFTTALDRLPKAVKQKRRRIPKRPSPRPLSITRSNSEANKSGTTHGCFTTKSCASTRTTH